MRELDTIAAVSTPRGKGGVAMIRISGTDALEFAGRVFYPKSRKKLSEISSNRAVYGDIKEKDADGNYNIIDDGMATVYRAPHSYTGEDTVEICCHGGVLVTESVLAACFAAGCRPAEAGEFTRRAFAFGRMSLMQAESLGALLEAKTHSQMLLSRGGVAGNLTREIENVYEKIRAVLASAYAGIDFPDEDLASMTADEMLCETEDALSSLRRLAGTYKAGHAISEGVRTVICGKTNVGKSSLYNRIVGRDAAIVTSVEGTTRDILTETAALGKVTLLLCDTAGMRDSTDEVESIGIRRAKEALDVAELVFAVFDVSRPLDDDDEELIGTLASVGAPVIALLNKCDSENDGEVAERVRKSFAHVLTVSAKNGDGMDGVKNTVEALFDCGEIDLRSDAVVADARQYASLSRASEHLMSARDSFAGGMPLDLCSVDLEAAMSDLSELDGREVTEEIVSEIFSHFCVGK